MKNETDIKKLATLSQILISETEEKELKKDIEAILSYVEQIQEVSSDFDHKETIDTSRDLFNVMREDILHNY